MSETRVCKRCSGTGRIEEWDTTIDATVEKECWECDGSGEVFVSDDQLEREEEYRRRWTCPFCGKLTGYYHYSFRDIRCRECKMPLKYVGFHYVGVETCDDCGGSGRYRGRNSCNNCAGTGKRDVWMERFSDVLLSEDNGIGAYHRVAHGSPLYMQQRRGDSYYGWVVAGDAPVPRRPPQAPSGGSCLLICALMLTVTAGAAALFFS